jgi:hypothetical protein
MYLSAVHSAINAKVRKQMSGNNIPSFPATSGRFRPEQLTIGGKVYPVAAEDPSGNKIITGNYIELDEKDLTLPDAYETEMYRRKPVKPENGIGVWVYRKKKHALFPALMVCCLRHKTQSCAI